MSEALTHKQQVCKRVCEYEKRKRATDEEWCRKKYERSQKWLVDKYRNDPEFRKKTQEKNKLYARQRREREKEAKQASKLTGTPLVVVVC